MLHGGSGGMSGFGLSSLGKLDCAARGEPQRRANPPHPRGTWGKWTTSGQLPPPSKGREKKSLLRAPSLKNPYHNLMSHSNLINQYTYSCNLFMVQSPGRQGPPKRKRLDWTKVQESTAVAFEIPFCLCAIPRIRVAFTNGNWAEKKGMNQN